MVEPVAGVIVVGVVRSWAGSDPRLLAEKLDKLWTIN